MTASRRLQSPARHHAGRTGAPRRRRTDSPEHIEQKSLINWLDLAATRHPILARVYKIPNEALRSKLERHLVLSEGLRKGVLDLHLPVARKGHIGLWIEFKSARGKLSPEQKDWAAFLRSEGHLVCEYRSWQVAAQTLINYLDLPIKIDDIPLPTPATRKTHDAQQSRNHTAAEPQSQQPSKNNTIGRTDSARSRRRKALAG